MDRARLGKTLVTDRLILRPVRSGDAPRIAQIINDPGIARMTSKIPHPYQLADATTFCKVATDGDLMIEIKGGDIIGGVGVDHADCAVPEIGYWLGRASWGQGFATEAMGAVLDWVRLKYQRRAAAAGHFDDNPASGRVLVKSGFLYTGEIQPRFSQARGERAATRMMVWLA